MQLGISTYSFPWGIGISNFTPPQPLTPHKLLQYAAEKDIRFVQFGDNYPLHMLSDDKLRELRSQADKLNVSIQVGARKLTVENILKYIPIAVGMQTDFIRVVIDDEDYHPSENTIIDIINQLVPHLQSANLILAIENHDRFSAFSLRDIIESTSRRQVAVCLDTANSLGAGEGMGEILSVLAPYTVNLHIKDFVVKRVNHKMGFRISGCVAGSGLLDIPTLIEEVGKHGRCYSAILELWSDPESTMEETIEKERESVGKSIEYLKTIIS